MKFTTLLKQGAACAAVLALGLVNSPAQSTATWTNAVSGEWNTAGNWDIGVPGDGTNALIKTAVTVNYNLPMSGSGDVLALTDSLGVLNVNTNGFVVNTAVLLFGNTSTRLSINNNGSMSVTNGGITLTTNAVASLAAGGSLSMKGTFNVGANGSSSSGGGSGFFTNSGGTLTVGGLTVNAKAGNPQTCLALINGGTNTLGKVTVNRSASTTSYATLGTEGLVVQAGLVNMTSLGLGPDNSAMTINFSGGVITNTGNFTLQQATQSRGCRFLQTGGLFVMPDSSIAYVNATATTNAIHIYSVTGGTNILGGFYFGGSNAVAGVGANPVPLINFTNAGTIYIGSQGINSNGVSLLTASLGNGGLFGASTDWTNSAAMTLNGGTFTFQAADINGTAHNIYCSGKLGGSGGLTKTGNGTLTLTATNSYSGTTTINAGTLALATDVNGSSGNIAGGSITVSANGVFDVSGINGIGGFVLGSAKTIAGTGNVTGTFTAAQSSIISPAGSSAQGTLNFGTGLTASNATFSMELTGDPTGTVTPNDVVSITGDFTVNGTNIISITPVGSLGVGTYKLIKFTGNFNGDLTNLSCVAGTLVHNPGEIDLQVTSVRPAASLVWRGDGSANLWNTAGASNWLNGASLDRFYTGDTNRFDDSATNFTVNISGIVTPASGGAVTVNTTNTYTFADAGSGDISGATGLTKTNSGTLVVLNTNDYTGVTTISGGTLAVNYIAYGGVSSPIGAAANGPANLVVNGGTLEYRGGNLTTDRGMTFGANGAAINVTNSTKTLTLSGTLTGVGSLTKTGNGQITLTGGNDYGGGTIINAGTVRANPSGSLGTNTLTLNGGTSTANFSFAGDTQTMSDIVNVVGTNNTVTTSGNDTIGKFTGTGTVYLEQSAANQTLTLQSVDTTAFNGTFAADTLAFIRLFPSSGTTLNASNAVFDLGAQTNVLINRDGGNYYLGALAGGSGTQVRGSANSGSAATTYTIGGKNIDSAFAGIIRTGTGGTGAKVNIVKVGTGKLTLTGANTYNGTTTVSSGTLALGDGVTDGSIGSSATISVASGAFLDVYGRSDGTLQLGSGQTLQGSGTVHGSLNANGTVSPGSGNVGTLTVTNSITLAGTAWMKLNNSVSPNSDRLVSSLSSISYGGNLVVSNAGPALHMGDTFILFSGSGLNTSGFSSIALPNYYTWDTSNLGVNGTVSVTATLPPPAISSVDYSTLPSGSITINASNGAAGGPVVVLTSTNLAAPLNTWTQAAAGNFDGSGNYSTAVTVNPAAPQSFYLIGGY